MSKCWRCGKEFGGTRSFSSSICPECELVELNEKKLEEERETRRQREREEEWQREESERRQKEAERWHRDAEEAKERRHREELEAFERSEKAQQQRDAKLQEQRQQENEFENAKMRCHYCKKTYTFRNEDGHGIYCSPKCAIDDLGHTGYREYLEKFDELLREKIIDYLKHQKYLSAIICAEGCKKLPPDVKGKIGHLCLNSKSPYVNSAWGEALLREAVSEGSLEAAKLFFSYNYSANTTDSSCQQIAKLLLPYFEDMQTEFNMMFGSSTKLYILEDILREWNEKSIAQEKIVTFIQQKKTAFLQDEYDTALRQKENAQTNDDFLNAAHLFDLLAEKNFKDAKEQGALCRNTVLQNKIDFAAQQGEQAKSFEDYLKVIELYLELKNLEVENAESWIDFFYSKANTELDRVLLRQPEVYDERIRQINLLGTKGFVYSEQLCEKCNEKIETLWNEALHQAATAATVSECYRAELFFRPFSPLKKEDANKAITAVMTKQKKITEITKKITEIAGFCVIGSPFFIGFIWVITGANEVLGDALGTFILIVIVIIWVGTVSSLIVVLEKIKILEHLAFKIYSMSKR